MTFMCELIDLSVNLPELSKPGSQAQGPSKYATTARNVLSLTMRGNTHFVRRTSCDNIDERQTSTSGSVVQWL